MDLFDQYVALVDGVKLTSLAAMIVTNLGTGIAVSIKTKTFNLKAVGKFLWSRVIPLLLGYLAIGVLALAEGDWMWAVTGAWALVLVTLTGAILQNLRELGLKIPDFLGGGK